MARHLLWIPAGAAVSFLAAFIFGDRLTLPVDLYYFIYCSVMLWFFAVYASATGLNLRAWISRRLGWAILLGLAVGAMVAMNVLQRPGTERLTGAMLAWAVLWRGLVYGAVDGVLLLAFPWIVTWRAFGAESAPWGRRLSAGATAWLLTLLLTTAYHLGYADFRSGKVVQPNIGNSIMLIPTLVAANPVASPIAHVVMHVAAVIHSPYTELFLPPHRPMRGEGL